MHNKCVVRKLLICTTRILVNKARWIEQKVRVEPELWTNRRAALLRTGALLAGTAAAAGMYKNAAQIVFKTFDGKSVFYYFKIALQLEDKLYLKLELTVYCQHIYSSWFWFHLVSCSLLVLSVFSVY